MGLMKSLSLQPKARSRSRVVGLKVKDAFFDRKAIQKGVDNASFRNLSKFGAFVSQTDKRSQKNAVKRKVSDLPPERQKVVRRRIKQGKKVNLGYKPSEPKQPPRVRLGLIKRFTFFSYDRRSRSVVIGPERLGGFVDKNVLSTLEFGGKTRRGHTVEPRPHTYPAAQKEAPKLEPLWKDSIRG